MSLVAAQDVRARSLFCNEELVLQVKRARLLGDCDVCMYALCRCSLQEVIACVVLQVRPGAYSLRAQRAFRRQVRHLDEAVL